MLINFITTNIIFKACFGYSFGMYATYMLTPQESVLNDFLSEAIQSIPSQIAGVLGTIYGVVIVLKKSSDGWHSHQKNRLDTKTAKENYEQSRIETQKMRKELEE